MSRTTLLSSAFRQLSALCLFALAAALPLHAWAVDTDGDGVDDAVDAFPNNAEATTDTDSDGKPNVIDYTKAQLIFSDDFSSGDFYTGGWTVSPVMRVAVTSGQAKFSLPIGASANISKTLTIPAGSARVRWWADNAANAAGSLEANGSTISSVSSGSGYSEVFIPTGGVTLKWNVYASTRFAGVYYVDDVTVNASVLVMDNDNDNDGVLDATDACPLDATASTGNVDKDVLCDVADPDDDNDAIADTADNCQAIVNPQQVDDDLDGVGNACENDGPGKLDATFASSAGVNNMVGAAVVQPNGKVLIGGTFSSYNGMVINHIARLNADGSLDEGFHPGAGASGSISALALQPDGKVLIGGNFISYNGVAANRFARLNADGTLDSNFATGTGANAGVRALALQPDGKVLMGGYFTSYNGVTANRIVRLNADGTLDSSFATGTGANSTVHALALQPDGKVLIGGDFISYNGVTANRIARLNADGTLDNSFAIDAVGYGTVYTLVLQPDGRVLIGGSFTSYNGVVIKHIARLSADGTLDNSFAIDAVGYGTVYTLALQPDGKVLMGGDFTSYNGVAVNRIARLNADGALDEGFHPGTGASSTVYTLAMQSDGKALIGGSFPIYNNVTTKYIARIFTGDKDQDGVGDAADWFNNSVAAVDTDRDGLPDAWLQPNPYGCAVDAATCNDLVLDTDDDNDAVPDYLDPEPFNAANSSVWPINGNYTGSGVTESQGIEL